jgi:hypothetical protein
MVWRSAEVWGRIGIERAELPHPGAASVPVARRLEPESVTTSDPKPALDPKKNPTYPQRVHLLEKPHWEGVLQQVEARLVVPRQKLKVLGNDPKRPAFERIFAQMLGARDQVADAVKRLPLETGGLYEEDHHRVEEAVKALDRLLMKWDAETTAR